ncbi:serine carboxypeptidase [Hirsutella rhossiliensis]|uniref:Serine carboxypeptidase domain-containing protein n=1 Tax=Hirsutella rhossiliensis TaxID=111463 RepID=A0A9P8MUZ4_9HYPO|nr:serine carboxypeptidase domain-containing protein [Hirsutella rhossiliensis]KAH0961629.1 serine carboxypeptidase domain-containing protein [Hirsutella rhossiliensis]
MLIPLTALVAASGLALAQFVSQDARVRNLTVVPSPGDAGVTVSFKEPKGACRTAFDSQRQFTGWVNIPGQFPTNLFFWFVEAREPTESLAIWLNGGPGASSLLGLFSENGPCEVVERGLEDYDTVAREWGWDRASNMLFIDQPNQVGFSYDTPTNGTFSAFNGSASTPPSRPDDSLPPWASANGTFSTNDPRGTANTTRAAAMAAWHAIQGFLTTFPQYQPSANASVALSLVAQSYGGVYGPVFAETWEAQNQKRLTGVLNRNTTLELRLTSLGIFNGCVDSALQVPTLPVFANNNTYDIKALSDTEAGLYRDKFFARSGCRDLLAQCQAAAAGQPWEGNGNNQTDADAVCRQATLACLDISQPYLNSGKSAYDIAALSANPEPPPFFADYLNQAGVQAAIGSPVNFTMTSNVVSANFSWTGDFSKGGNVHRLAALLQRGVRLGLVYGDRDYVCNWFGGEAVSLAVAQQAGGEYAAKFPTAGYAPIVVNDSYIGGEVRQYGNLSFSRIYQAGHAVAWYQPETAFQVFARILLGRSVSMGNMVDLAKYNTSGPLNSTRSAKAPDPPKPTCFIRAMNMTCDADALELARHGGGVVINGVLYSKADDWVLATVGPTATSTSTSSPSADAMTGLYTATATPSSAACFARPCLPVWELGVALLALCSLVSLM